MGIARKPRYRPNSHAGGPPRLWGMACSTDERTAIVFAAQTCLVPGSARINWAELARLSGRHVKTVKRVWERAHGIGQASSMSRLPTGGAANSRPRMGWHELSFLKARGAPPFFLFFVL